MIFDQGKVSSFLILIFFIVSSSAAFASSIVDESALTTFGVHLSNGRNRTIYCKDNIPGEAKPSGNMMRFTSFAEIRRKAKIQNNTQRANKYKELLYLGKIVCSQGTKPGPTLTPNVPIGNFDTNGNVTSIGKVLFGIPSYLPANVSIGRQTFEFKCRGCHGTDDRLNRTFSQYRQTISGPPMYLSSVEVTDGDLAHITAYLNVYRQ